MQRRVIFTITAFTLQNGANSANRKSKSWKPLDNSLYFMYHLFCILVNGNSYKVQGCMITIKLFVKAFGVCTVQYLYSNFVCLSVLFALLFCWILLNTAL